MTVDSSKAQHLDCGITPEPESGRVLLHACCAPCSAAIVEYLLAHDYRPTVFFCNPNIYPEAEYLIRKRELIRFLSERNVPFVEAEYSHEAWLEAVRGHEQDAERGSRCQLCFTLRLTEAARYAAAEGFPYFTTTLASSRWKDLRQVDEAGRVAASRYPATAYWARNWRRGGLTERRSQLLRSEGFYNQQYCGCEFSLRQMQAWRARRAEEKANSQDQLTV